METVDLQQTLSCGQCFRWQPQADGSWWGVAGGRALRLRQEQAAGLAQDPFWRRYFDLDGDYPALRARLAALHPVLRQAIAQAPGLHLLRQDPWEALCSFLLSQNNNIPRIQGCVQRLCQAFGAPLGEGLYAFPAAQTLAQLEEADLAPLRCGYRARYLLDAARQVSSGGLDLHALRTAPVEQARAALRGVCGVGPKVADCVLLYGLHRLEAFPLDVWMKRVMAALFPKLRPADFGPAAGLAQQYLFVWARRHPAQLAL